jgi:hypothetical protein
MSIQQAGTEPTAWNIVDIPPFHFTPNSGSNSGVLLTNFPEGGSSGIQVQIAFDGLNTAFGFNSWSGNDAEGAVLDVFRGTTLVGSQALTNVSGAFLGYVLTGVDTSTAVQFRSNRHTPGMVGERFYLDNLAGSNANALAGDYNQNGIVDAADYVMWRSGAGTTYAQTDYDVWRSNFGQSVGSGAALPSAEPLSAAVPEPASWVSFCLGMIAVASRRTSAGRNENGQDHSEK